MSGPAQDDSFTASEDTPLVLSTSDLLGNDPTGTIILDIGNATGGTVGYDENGNIVFTPTADYTGAASFEYIALDDLGEVSIATVNLTVTAVNDAPIAGNDSGLTTTEDTPVTISASTLLQNDTDADGDALTLAGVSNAVGGTVSINAQGNVVFTPNANYNGAASFSYTVSDGNGGTSSATVSLTVTPVNDAPVANANTFSATEDTAITLTPAQLLGNDSDVEGNALTLNGVSNPVNGTVGINGAGNVVFTPAANYFGAASFQYSVSDGQGGFATATVTLNIAAVNDKPIVVTDTFNGSEDVPLVLSAAQLLANDSDVEGGTLSILAVSGAVNGTVVKDAQGNVTFTPTADYYGPASFKYTVSDGQGGFTTGTVNLAIASVNDAPVAGNDSGYTTAEDTELLIPRAQLLGNDSDVEGDPLSIQSVQDATGGTVSLFGYNDIRFVPDTNYNGPASFTYTVSDGNGGTSTATVNLTVTPVNDAPVAVADGGFTTAEDTPLTILPGQLLGNDSDIEGNPLTVSSVGNAVGGSVWFMNGVITFMPDPDYNGPASFRYYVSDGQFGVSSAMVSLTVTPVNDAPVANADSIIVTEDTPQYIVPSILLGNDTDPDSYPLTIISVQDAVNGTVELVNGVPVFTPDVEYTGPASFTYTVSDGDGGTSTATVNLTVEPDGDNTTPGDDIVHGTAGDDTISSIGGNDTVFGHAGNDVLNGGDGNDILSGGDGNDTLNGGTGNDQLAGGAGNDALNGGDGIDLADYSAATAATLWVDLAAGTASGEGTDTLTGIENYKGSQYEDIVTGSAGDNALMGLAGNDQLYGGGGADFLDGGDGDDILAGGEGDDWLRGGDGDDQFIGGAGADTLDGFGGGSDTVLYGGSSAGVTVNLTSQTASGGDATGDTLSGIDNVVGSAYADTLTGAGNANILTGGGGNDTLDGRGYNDILEGGEGSDLYGIARGDGIDSIIQAGISDAATATDTLRFASGIGYDQLWFSHVGNDLRIDVIGETESSVLLKDWYSDASRRVDMIETVDGGHALSAANVEALVTAMAGYSAPAAGEFSLSSQVANDLQPVFATTWA